MKHLWEKASTERFADGGKRIEYQCKDFPGISVCSNTKCIPHANRGGGWMCHSFSVETSVGFRKDFRTLKEANAFVENGGLDHANQG